MKCPAEVYQPSTRVYQGLPDIDYPLHDKTIVVTRCGRICLGKKKINFSQVFAGQAVGFKEVHDDIWLVSFIDYDLGRRMTMWAATCSGILDLPFPETRSRRPGRGKKLRCPPRKIRTR